MIFHFLTEIIMKYGILYISRIRWTVKNLFFIVVYVMGAWDSPFLRPLMVYIFLSLEIHIFSQKISCNKSKSIIHDIQRIMAIIF